MVSEAKVKANQRYEDKAYDRLSVLLPKGTKDRITATGSTVNGYISAVVLAALDDQDARTSKPEAPGASVREETYQARASKVEDARASNSVNVPCDIMEKLRGYGDPEKIILTAAKNALKLYDTVM